MHAIMLQAKYFIIALLLAAVGHNWGSPHDPDTPECLLSGSNGGKFLMYQYSVSGLESNNKVRLSPASHHRFNVRFSMPVRFQCWHGLHSYTHNCGSLGAKILLMATWS